MSTTGTLSIRRKEKVCLYPGNVECSWTKKSYKNILDSLKSLVHCFIPKKVSWKTITQFSSAFGYSWLILLNKYPGFNSFSNICHVIWQDQKYKHNYFTGTIADNPTLSRKDFPRCRKRKESVCWLSTSLPSLDVVLYKVWGLHDVNWGPQLILH